MAGKVAPDTVNPVPCNVTEFTVTGDGPFEVSVSVFVDFVLIVTVPKSSVLALIDNCRVPEADCTTTAPQPLSAQARQDVTVKRRPR